MRQLSGTNYERQGKKLNLKCNQSLLLVVIAIRFHLHSHSKKMCTQDGTNEAPHFYFACSFHANQRQSQKARRPREARHSVNPLWYPRALHSFPREWPTHPRLTGSTWIMDATVYICWEMAVPHIGPGAHGLNQEPLMAPESNKVRKWPGRAERTHEPNQSISSGHSWSDLNTQINNNSDGEPRE